MTSLWIIPSVLEVSCAMQDLSRGQNGRLAKGWVCGLVDFGASRLSLQFSFFARWISEQSIVTKLSVYSEVIIVLLGAQVFCAITPNGPAIWGGCVTWRSIRAVSINFRQNTVPVQGGYGTRFCSHSTIIGLRWVSRYKLIKLLKLKYATVF